MLTLPNLLTLLRILAIPVFLAYLSQRDYAAAFMIFLGAGVTDAVDGTLARMTNSKSKVGAAMDPVADKLLLLSSFIVLALNGAIPIWLVATVIARDIVVLTGYASIYIVHSGAPAVNPTRMGKANTFFELFTIGFVVMHMARPLLPLEQVTMVIMIITAITTAYSGSEYVYQGWVWHKQNPVA